MTEGRASARYLFSAKGAAIIRNLGQRPRDSFPESGAFSASLQFGTSSWGVAPGCDDVAPLALNTYSTGWPYQGEPNVLPW